MLAGKCLVYIKHAWNEPQVEKCLNPLKPDVHLMVSKYLRINGTHYARMKQPPKKLNWFSMPQAIPQKKQTPAGYSPKHNMAAWITPGLKTPPNPALEPGTKESPAKYHAPGAYAKLHQKGSFPSPRYAHAKDSIQEVHNIFRKAIISYPLTHTPAHQSRARVRIREREILIFRVRNGVFAHILNFAYILTKTTISYFLGVRTICLSEYFVCALCGWSQRSTLWFILNFDWDRRITEDFHGVPQRNYTDLPLTH